MSDDRAPEAQEQQQGITVEPQFVIQSLQNKVAQLTQENMMLEALANQQQATISELAAQLSQVQQQVAESNVQPIHNGRTTKGKAKA